MKSSSLLLVAGLALATAGVAVAQERPRSLNDARSDVIHGTGGITLFDFGRKSEPAAAAAPAPAAPAAGAPGAAGNAAAPTSGWGTPVAVPAGSTTRAATAPSAAPAAAPAPAARKPLFGNLGEIFGPPSGEPLSSAKKHESPSSGIALPTGR
ncbi:hypothetical protein [Azohydromonas sediminis]|uniref:hypothetical protein n=1 Tax=Azohydromonas sediminis TaxID=2259674 RepID=UPI000E65C794|nr:hypothetical protein [Azohydromonas sediminis]